jgi:hypothetical protein
MIRADYGGSGKSYICEYFEEMGFNVLFVVPTNVLVQKYNEAVTINEFFGFGINEDMKVKQFDDSPYDVIAFDEILFSDVSNLRKIKNYVDNNTDKIVVATGDTDQLPPIKTYSNTKEHKPYANECVNLIFPIEIYLYINKRLKTQEDRDKLEQKQYVTERVISKKQLRIASGFSGGIRIVFQKLRQFPKNYGGLDSG